MSEEKHKPKPQPEPKPRPADDPPQIPPGGPHNG